MSVTFRDCKVSTIKRRDILGRSFLRYPGSGRVAMVGKRLQIVIEARDGRASVAITRLRYR